MDTTPAPAPAPAPAPSFLQDALPVTRTARLARPSDWESRGSLHCKLPPAAGEGGGGGADAEVEAALRAALAAFGGIERIELYNKGAYAARPFAMVNLCGAVPTGGAAASLLAAGAVDVLGHRCALKVRRAPQRHRKRQADASEAAARAREAAIEAARSEWQPEMLARYPSRATTLDQAALVADLTPALRENLALYLKVRFPGSEEVAAIVWRVAERCPTALRVKELFENVEAASMIGREIAAANKAAAKRSRRKAKRPKEQQVGEAAPGDDGGPDAAGLQVVYDLACGHGLLGCLLAYRFSALRVVCVDLQRRNGFDVFVRAFEELGERAAGAESVLGNLEFVEGDIVDVPIESGAFVASVHGCNEVSKIGVERAIAAGACWATIPCCIRDGIYTVQRTSRVSDEQRYAAMVGVLAGTYGARFISGIDRQITNRNLCVFGGELLQVTCPKAEVEHGSRSGAAAGHHEQVHD